MKHTPKIPEPTKLGIDHNSGKWTPAQYVIDAGWDVHCIEATAEHGVASCDAADLTSEQQSALFAFCQERCQERNNQPAQHTPVPWTRNGTHIYYQKNPGGYRFDVAEVFRDVGAMAADANAEFLCRAINSHADLLAALRECERQYLPTPLMCKVRAALLKAGVQL